MNPGLLDWAADTLMKIAEHLGERLDRLSAATERLAEALEKKQ